MNTGNWEYGGNGRAPYLLLLGGSFNPPHIAHLRAALEAREALRPEKTLFIPASSPPHKPDARLLPFGLRVEMLKQTLAPLPKEWGLEVCEVENERHGPSYTADTLEIMTHRHQGKRLMFLLGAEDYAQLASWRHWASMPRFADFVVVPRKNHGEDSFHSSTLSLWPKAKEQRLPLPDPPEEAADAPPSSPRLGYILPGGALILYLPLAMLEISSSLIRERFLSRLSLDFLIPPAVQALIESEYHCIQKIWSSEYPFTHSGLLLNK